MSKKKQGKKPAADDDDWEALLDKQIAENKAVEATKAAAAPAPAPAPAPAADDDDDDDEETGAGAGGAKKDKKKKKKGKGGKKEPEEAEEKKPAGPLSAQAKAILERQKAQQEGESKMKALREAEETRIREEEEKVAAEEKAAKDEMNRKAKAKQDKVDAQKAAGTYMTKAEKEKKAKAEARLEALKAAGIEVPKKGDGSEASKSQASMNVKKAPKKAAPAPAPVPAPVVEKAPTPPPAPEPVVEKAAIVIEGLSDNWDDDGDDWEMNLDSIATQVVLQKAAVAEDVEDMLVLENKSNQEHMKKLAIERAKLEEGRRLKREEEEAFAAEVEAKEREAAMRKETSRRNRMKRDELAMAARSPDHLRSAISCIMGHVDTGKTKLLDKIRNTNVQEGEAGGITQQIGATQFSKETLQLKTQAMQDTQPFVIKLPGLLMIDTPGHESFANLRSRGSSLCDIAILVIDLMHGLEQQTIESISMLKKKRTPFIVALNKVDRCYGWKVMPDSPIQVALAAQDENTQREFRDRTTNIITQLMENSLNAALYWENDDLAGTVSLIPTSAHSGEGVPDLLKNLICLTQERLWEKLMYTEVLQCSVLEVKVIEGLGHTVDVVLVNGTLREGDQIVVSTMDGPVITNIRALLTPPPNREMRVKSEYLHHQELKGAIGIKIVAPDIGRAVAGTPIMVVRSDLGDELDDVMDDVQSDLSSLMKGLETDSKGVMVHANTLGALEALLHFLRDECKPPIPVSHFNIGPIHKKDVMRAALMNDKKMPEYATILAFDVPIDPEAQTMTEELNVKVFKAEIIYHLFDQFTAYISRLIETRKQEAANVVVFPCVLKIMPQHIFNKKDPIVVGVDVLEGTLRVGTYLCIPQLSLDVGKVTKIEANHKEVQTAKKGTQVSIRIQNDGNPNLYYGRQFDHTSALYSKINRASIDACKEFFKDEMTKDDWLLIVKLKKVFGIS